MSNSSPYQEASLIDTANLSQLLLARTVTCRKPPVILLREYIHDLARCIRSYLFSQDEPATPKQLINRDETWKSKYVQQYTETESLRNKLSEFERQIESLKSQLRDSTLDQNMTKKRSRSAGGNAGSVAKYRKTQNDASSVLAAEATFKELSEEIKACDLLIEAQGTLLRHLYDLHKLQQQECPDPHRLASTITSTASATADAVTTFCDAHQRQYSTAIRQCLDPVKAALDNETEIFLRALTRAITLLLQSFDGLELKTQQDTPVEDKVSTKTPIHALASLFHSVLTTLKSAAYGSAKFLILAEQQVVVATAAKTPGPSSGATTISSHRQPTRPKASVPHVLGRLLIHLLAHRNATAPILASAHSKTAENQAQHPPLPHAHLQEAYASLLLTRAGALLYNYTFKHPRNSNVADDITTPVTDISHLVASAVDTSTLVKSPTRLKVEANAADIEARVLVVVLDHACNPKVAPWHAVSRAAEVRGSSALAATEMAREKLQWTLVRGCFGAGEEEHQWVGREWFEIPPAVAFEGGRGDAGSEAAAEEEEDVGTWFGMEMWRLCGWDVLGKEAQALMDMGRVG